MLRVKDLQLAMMMHAHLQILFTSDVLKTITVFIYDLKTTSSIHVEQLQIIFMTTNFDKLFRDI